LGILNIRAILEAPSTKKEALLNITAKATTNAAK
jgi:hypothetical protein